MGHYFAREASFGGDKFVIGGRASTTNKSVVDGVNWDVSNVITVVTSRCDGGNAVSLFKSFIASRTTTRKSSWTVWYASISAGRIHAPMGHLKDSTY